MPIPAKQIEKILAAFVRVSAFTANGTSDTVTTPITSALSTAGNGGASVPLQVSSGVTVVGVVTASGKNLVALYDATTKLKLTDGSDNEVYARLTESGGAYTLTYYSLVAGTETSYSFASDTSIDFEFIYRFDFDRLPSDAIATTQQRNVSDDPASGGASTAQMIEVIACTSTNTLDDLSETPTATTSVILYVNGVAINAFGGGSAAFSISGVAITWSASNAGFALATTDKVLAVYPYAV